jgi:hypothetical protein
LAIDQLILTALASALGTLFAGGVGYGFAMSRFRKERAFERRLTWYEAAVKKLVESANDLNWALAGDMIGAKAEARTQAWSAAYNSLLRLRGLEIEAQLYATADGYEAVSAVVEHVSTISTAVMYKGERDASGDWAVPTRLFEIERKLLLHAASTLASDVREHLQLDELKRDWSVYDKVLNGLLEELEGLRARGIDFSKEAPYGLGESATDQPVTRSDKHGSPTSSS